LANVISDPGRGSVLMNWYLTTLLLYRDAEPRIERPVQRCHYLVTADDHDRAYEKSIRLGDGVSRPGFRFAGVSDLLLIYDTPEDSAELLWTQIEIAPTELENQVRGKEQMQAFQREGANPSGWYLGDVVLYEVHDEGSHGEDLLVWINSYLIRAKDPETAYLRAIQIGKGQEDEPGSHRCGEDKAHWRFKGVRDLVPVREAPADNALLWCDDAKTNTAPEGMVPRRSELSVFKWQAAQLRQRAPQQTEH
jgi:hypothetical protein